MFIFQYIFLGLLCIGIDYLVFRHFVKKNDYIRALLDNFGHGLIAAVSWLVVSGIRRESVIQAVCCAAMSSGLDIDHFVMAKSLKIKDANSLHTRPPLHTTTIVPILTPILQVWCGQNIHCLQELPYMFVVAVLSHHLRDAQRRGLWFWPVGSTPPLPYGIYIICVILLPMVVKDARAGIKRLSSGHSEQLPAANNGILTAPEGV
ncbi:Transmembrane protein C5orf28-like [Exaiptasia diaphana]|nr:Transmembrane protein C5orf28-like [Exaiptasia diaphana]